MATEDKAVDAEATAAVVWDCTALFIVVKELTGQRMTSL